MYGDNLAWMKTQKPYTLYVTRIRQVAALLAYEEPQILEV